jgi:hypothetical protein
MEYYARSLAKTEMLGAKPGREHHPFKSIPPECAISLQSLRRMAYMRLDTENVRALD